MNLAGDMAMARTGEAAPASPGYYRAFGMLIRSDVALPELAPAAAGDLPDLSIVRLPDSADLPALGEGVVFRFGTAEQVLAWPEVAQFRLVGTDRIEVAPWPGVGDDYLAFPLLGPVMALMLHLRGLLVLHASAVEINGRSAIFVGDKMAGKSTTAAAFLRAGHRLLTDDLLTVDLAAEGGPRVLPAFAQLKLSDEASNAVAIEGVTKLPIVHEIVEKRQHRLAGEFSHHVVAPDAIYVLDRGGDVPAIEPLTGVDALTAVMRFSYISRFGRGALDREAEAKHLRGCAALARHAAVARLHIPASLDRLDETVTLVGRALAGDGRG